MVYNHKKIYLDLPMKIKLFLTIREYLFCRVIRLRCGCNHLIGWKLEDEIRWVCGIFSGLTFLDIIINGIIDYHIITFMESP